MGPLCTVSCALLGAILRLDTFTDPLYMVACFCGSNTCRVTHSGESNIDSNAVTDSIHAVT